MLWDVWNFLWPGWPSVYPNLVASAISGSVVWLWARRHIRRLHRRNDELHEAIKGLHEHTEKQVTKRAADTNRLVRALADNLGIDPETGENRLPRPRT